MPEAQEQESDKPAEKPAPQQQKLPLDLTGGTPPEPPVATEPAKPAAAYPLKPKTAPFRRPVTPVPTELAEPVAAAVRNEPVPRTVVRFTCGHLLKDAREKMHLSPVQLSQRTKIPREFIEQIEANRLEDLPPPVYAKSYLRQLCREFSLDPASFLEDYARALDGSAADAGNSQFVVTSEPNETGAKVGYRPRSQVEPQKNMKKFSPSMIAVTIVVVILGVLVLIAIVMNQSRNRKTNSSDAAAATGTVDANVNLESYITPQQLPMKELPVPGK